MTTAGEYSDHADCLHGMPAEHWIRNPVSRIILRGSARIALHRADRGSVASLATTARAAHCGIASDTVADASDVIAGPTNPTKRVGR